MKCKYASEAAAIFEKMMMQAAHQQQGASLPTTAAGERELERPAGLPVSESRAVLSEDEGTVVGDAEEMKEKSK